MIVCATHFHRIVTETHTELNVKNSLCTQNAPSTSIRIGCLHGNVCLPFKLGGGSKYFHPASFGVFRCVFRAAVSILCCCLLRCAMKETV